jgi:AraC-like DNA-binding protein
VPTHSHGPPSLVYGVGGPCIEVSPSLHSTVRRRLTYLPAGYTHALDYVGPTQVFAIEAAPDAVASLGLGALEHSRPLPASLYDRIWTILLRLGQADGLEELDEAVMRLWEEAVYHLNARLPIWLPALIEMLHENWHKQPSAAELAGQLGFSPQFLCRSFRRWMGMTMTRYNQAIRLDYARGLLWGSGTDLAAVATMTGFTDQSHLTRALRRHSGRTPGALRSDSVAPPVKLRHRYPPD